MIDFNERLDQIRGNMNEPPMNGGLDFNDRLEKIRGSGQPIILNDAQMAVINDVDERERGPAPETFDPLSLSDWGNKVAAPLGISAGRMITDTALGGGGLVLGNLGMDEAAKWLLNKNVDVSDWWSGLNASTAGENPHFVSDVASGVGSSLGFMLAGAGAMGAASKLGRVGQLAAGAFTEGGLEALTEAGGFLTEAQAQGQYDKGLSAANKSFVSNAGLNMLLNLAGGRYNPYLDKIPGFAGWLAKTAAEVGEEALLQEPLQGVIESAASKTLQNGGDFLPNLWESLKEYPEILQQVGPSSAASTALIQALFGVAGMGQAVTQTDQTVANPEQDVTQTEQIVATPEQDVAQTEQRPPIDFNERLAQVREQIREQLKESAGQETETETAAEADTPIARMKQDVVKLRESATRSREEAQKRGDTNEVKTLDRFLENLDNYEKELDAEAAQETKAKPGKTARVRTAAGTEVDTVYRIKSADDLVTSDNASYPAELQPRQRDRAASQKQVDGIANKLDPTLLGESRLASDGAPIVGADGIVESGNGRVMGIRKAYQHGKGEGYQSWLRENAGAFGLSDVDFEGVNNPVLVRERTGDVDRAKFAMEANESSVAQMSRTERAMSDAKKMTPDILGRFNPEKSVANNRDFLEDFARTVIPQNELGAFFDANGNLSQEGEQRVRDALFAAAYGDPDVMSRVAESLDNDVKNVTHAMLEAAPKIAAMEKTMEGGGLHQELSIKKDITDAVKTLAALKAEGNTVENYLAQMTLPGTEDAEISPEAKALLNFFNKNRRSAKAIAEGLGRYAELATAEGSPDQVRMFGEDEAPRRTKRDVLRQALNGEEAPRAPKATKKASNAREAVKDELRREIRGKQEGYDDEYAEAWAEAAITLVESEAKSRGISVDDVAKEWGLEVVKDPEGEGIPTGDVYEQIGRKRKTEMDAQLAKKRPDLSPEQRAATIDAIERLGEETRQGGNPKLEKAATYWALNGHINMAQENDVNKIKRAIEVCEQHGLDPMSFKDPNTILSEYEYKEKAERLDPDDVFAFSNKQTFSDGITVYDVQDDLEGQQAVRAIIDTHWGENANPWCLAAGHDLDGHGDAWRMWENYSGTDKRIAFKDGKLLAFCASEDDTVTWWDREDEAHSGIPYVIKKDGNKTYYRYNEERGQSLKIREELKDGTERHYWDNGQMSSEIKANGERRRYRENGNIYYEVIPGEVTRVWRDNGQLRREAWANGITKEYNEDGSPVEEKKPTPRQNNEYLGQELKLTVLDTGEEIYQQSIGENGAASLDAADAGQRMDNLGVARDMEKSGKDAKAIRMATGWERGADGKWRYEILDGKLTERGELLEKATNGQISVEEFMRHMEIEESAKGTIIRLPDFYDAPELYAAYRKLKSTSIKMQNAPITEDGMIKINELAHYDPFTNTITLTAGVPNSNFKSLLVHEIQHAVQIIEGFDTGEGFTGDRDKYKKQAGETEARNAERRMDMSTEARRKTLLAETEDVAREDQIILRDALGAGNNARAYTRFQREVKNDAGEIIQEAKTIIGILKNADKSSPIHELGHVWLDRMRRMAQMEGIPQDVKDDWKILTDWLRLRGIDFSKDLSGEDLKRWQDAQEKFAAGWEKYFATGKAPNKRLQGVFDKFKQWMKEIYQAVKNITWHGKDGKEHRFNLPQDVRRVMDRMLTPEERMEPLKVGEAMPEDHYTAEKLKDNPMVERETPQTGPHRFSDPETERRYSESKKKIRFGDKLRQMWTNGEFKELKSDKAESGDSLIEAREGFRLMIQRIRQRANETVRDLKSALGELTPEEYDLFGRKRALDDLMWRKKDRPEAELPWGLTDQTLQKEHERVTKIVEGNKKVKAAIAAEEQTQAKINAEMTRLADQLGWTELRKILRNPHYYRHEILEYAEASVREGFKTKTARVLEMLKGNGGAMDKMVNAIQNRGYLKRYRGSEKDMSSNYVEVMGNVRMQMLQDIEVMRALVDMRAKYDKSGELRAKLKDGESLRDVVPEGYTVWDPNGHGLISSGEGNASIETLMRMAAEEQANNLDEISDMMGVDSDVFMQAQRSLISEIIEKLATREGALWVIPKEVAGALNRVAEANKPGWFIKTLRKITKGWKKMMIVGPTRVWRYNFRNLTGDMDAVIAGNPRALGYAPKAAKELWGVMVKGEEATGDLKDYLDRATYMTGDINQLNFGFEQEEKLRELEEKLKKNESIPKKGLKLLDKLFWSGPQRLTEYREQIMRYACYLSYKAQMEKNDGRPDNWGASLREEVMSVEDIRDRAYKMSNELLGAYDQVSEFGQRMRDIAVPFYSWLEVNARRYKRLLQNGLQGDSATFLAAFTKGQIATLPLKAVKTYMMLELLTLAIKAFNNIWAPEAEEQLSEDVKQRPHITFGIDPSTGETLYFDRIGATLDILDWFAQDSPVLPFASDISEILDGKQTISGWMKRMSGAAFSKAVNAFNPIFKVPLEIAMGRTLYPDVTKPRIIKDVGDYLAGVWGLDREWRAFKGEPGVPYFGWKGIRKLFTYAQDAEEAAYFRTLENKGRFQERVLGRSFDGYATSRRGECLRKIKTALRFEDWANVERYMTQYKELGGKSSGLRRSLDAMDPLYGLNRAERRQFFEQLSPEDKKMLERAKNYYKGLRRSIRGFRAKRAQGENR